MTLTIAEAIAEVKQITEWPALREGSAFWTVMQAVASGDLIPRTDAELAVALAYQRAWDDFIKLHTAAFSVVQWFETSRPDLIGPRIEKLRDILRSDHFRPDDAPAEPLAEVERMRAEMDDAMAEAHACGAERDA